MKRVIILTFQLLIVLLSVVSCSHKKKDNSNVNKSVTTLDSSFLTIKNFVYGNLTNTSKVNFSYRSTKGGGLDLSNVYTDSTLQKPYVQLSESQKEFLLVPFLPKDYGAKYAKENMRAWFVSKQNKIDELQPIILLVLGNDYESLTLVLLDKNYRPISEFSLNKDNDDNNKIGYPHKTKSYSLLSKNEITSYRISANTDSAKKQMIIDSNVFKSVINKNGTISTKQIGKTRFTKFVK